MIKIITDKLRTQYPTVNDNRHELDLAIGDSALVCVLVQFVTERAVLIGKVGKPINAGSPDFYIIDGQLFSGGQVLDVQRIA